MSKPYQPSNDEIIRGLERDIRIHEREDERLEQDARYRRSDGRACSQGHRVPAQDPHDLRRLNSPILRI